MFFKKCGKCCNIKGVLRQSIIGVEYFCLRTMKSTSINDAPCEYYNKTTESAARNYLKIKEKYR